MMLYLTTSISSLLLLSVGVSARFIPSETDDSTSLRPIATRSQARRICAELCLAGLGGRACGADCVDLVPSELPVQFGAANESDESEEPYSRITRHGACTVLCGNNLGRPLCNCDGEETDVEPDYVQVCSFYCVEYDYRVYGCQKCSLYNATIPTYTNFSLQTLKIPFRPKADYNTWCAQQCKQGNGGVACNCDILPMLKRT